MFCKNCGAKISEEGNFCSSCGIPVKEESVATEKSQGRRPMMEAQSKSRKLIMIGGLLLVVGAAILFAKGVTGGKNKTEEVELLSIDAIKDLEKYDAYAQEKTEEKVLYLTFDCGYENGNTPEILDVLKKHNTKAAFFIVGDYLNSCPDLVKRMVVEGHIVGNHSFQHTDMSQMGKDDFSKELGELETLYEQMMGEPMKKYYRPPQGKYSKNSLQIAKDLGYKTFLWSLSYGDWNQDSQPSREEAFDKLLEKASPGAIVMLHNTSKTNCEILDELLSKWEEMGYTFNSLEELGAD